MFDVRDIKLKDDRPKELLLDKHEKYLKRYANDDAGPDQIMGEYLKMSGMYWGLNALYLMKKLDVQSPDITKALEFIKSCQSREDGGFAAAPRHDSHLLHTLCAVQILVILNKLEPDYIDVHKCVNYVKSLQQPDGSFAGDKWGEVDTRFSMCALATLKLLNALDHINLDKAIEFVMRCNNTIDGGFGSKPGSESHSAYVYCCVGSLAIAERLDLVDADQLGWWLSERQLPSGGLNGRPEKLPDLCYSWWCLASMKMINRMHMIDCNRLVSFILACQEQEQGGMSDRPGNFADPYHTMFGLASLSLIIKHQLGSDDNSDKSKKDEILVLLDQNLLELVDPVLCMPLDTLKNSTQVS